MRTRILSSSACAAEAAAYIAAAVSSKPGCAVAMDCSEQLSAVFEALGKLKEEGVFHPELATFFSVRELAGWQCMKEKLQVMAACAGIPDANCVFLSDSNVEAYEKMLADAGGLHLAVLGVEEKGRIGFNEPSSTFDSCTRRVPVTPAIRRELSVRNFPDCEYVLTMGIRTMTGAKNTVVLALGEARADALYRMLYGRNDGVVPAAFLQLNTEVLVLADVAAACLLGKDRLII